MKSLVWQWELFGGRSRSAGNTSTDGLVDSSLSITELVAREITQNTDDAMDEFRTAEYADVHEPKLTYRFVNYTGDDKKRIVKLLNLRDLREHAPFIKNPRTDQDLEADTCLSDLADLNVPLSVMYVIERGAVGLIGDPVAKPQKSRWYNALVSQGVSYHESDTQSGGTFGFGKAAFQLGSRLSMVIAYSHFPKQDGDSVTRRLGGYIYQRHHALESAPGQPYYTGFAEFGTTTQDGLGEHLTRPFEDADADELAVELGLAREASGDINSYGTSFMIVDPDLTPEGLRGAIELNWWPALMSNALEIDIIDYDGKSLPPRPLKRKDLLPYLECWNFIVGISEPSGDYQKLTSFYREVIGGEEVRLGKLAIVADETTCFERVLVEGETRASTIALIRQRKMVVEYFDFFEDRPPFVQGVLFSDPQIETHLAKAEPKEHDRWWVHAKARVKSEWPEDRKKVVQALFDRTYRTLAQFRSGLRVNTDEETIRLDRLSRRLGNLLKTRGSKGKPIVPPTSGTAPVSLSIPNSGIKRSENPAGIYEYTAPVTVVLDSDAKVDSVPAEIAIIFKYQEDTGGLGDRVPTNYSELPKGWTVSVDKVVGILTKSPTKFKATTAPIHGPFAIDIDGIVTLRMPTIAEEDAL